VTLGTQLIGWAPWAEMCEYPVSSRSHTGKIPSFTRVLRHFFCILFRIILCVEARKSLCHKAGDPCVKGSFRVFSVFFLQTHPVGGSDNVRNMHNAAYWSGRVRIQLKYLRKNFFMRHENCKINILFCEQIEIFVNRAFFQFVLKVSWHFAERWIPLWEMRSCLTVSIHSCFIFWRSKISWKSNQSYLAEPCNNRKVKNGRIKIFRCKISH